MPLLFTVSYFKNNYVHTDNYVIILKIGDCERKRHSDKIYQNIDLLRAGDCVSVTVTSVSVTFSLGLVRPDTSL